MQVGECLHHPLIGSLELLRAFRFRSAAPAPHTKPCHDTSGSTFLDDLNFLNLAMHQAIASAALPERRDRTTEQRMMRASFANGRNARRGPGGATCDEPHTVDSTL
jgi:hypothetical protein